MRGGSWASRDKASSWRGRRRGGREPAALPGRAADPAQRNPNRAQQNQSPAQQNQRPRATKSKRRATKSKSLFRSAIEIFQRVAPVLSCCQALFLYGRGGSAPFTRWRRSCRRYGTDSEHQPRPFVNELSMRAMAATSEPPSRRAFRRSSGRERDVLHPTALPPPAAASSALITASALVTVATFCTAKSIEALCHSAFIVEQQSSGRTTK